MDKKVYEFISAKTNDPIVEWKTCKRCGEEFAITQKDKDMLDTISPVLEGQKKLITTPTLCADCRLIRKLCFRNERKLYRRKCDASGKLMVSSLCPETNFLAYNPQIWNEDCGNGEKRGKAPDFEKSFLEQFYEISKQVPKRILSNSLTMENCEYSNYGTSAKDCYLSSGVAYSEQCHYSYTPLKCLSDIDGYLSIGCQYTYECIQCMMGYKLYYSRSSTACKESAFLQDCVNCDHCFGCVNLIGKKYYFMNQEMSPGEYEQKVSAIMGSHSAIEQFKKDFATFALQFPKIAIKTTQAEHCIGHNITNASDCVHCFSVMGDVQTCRDCVFCGEKAHDLHSCYQVGIGSQWVYDAMGCTRGYRAAFCHQADPIESYYAEWSMDMGGSSHLFLSSGMKLKHNMILNTSYEPKERESLVARVIDKMQSDGERGEFFPPKFSPYPFNDTVALEYFPLQKVCIGDTTTVLNAQGKGIVTVLEPDHFLSKAILDLGGEEKVDILWRTKEIDIVAPQGMDMIAAKDLPDNITDVTDDILQKGIICEISGRPFKLIKQELDFYREHNIPLPRRHYEVRHMERISSLPPMNLSLRNCDKCGNEMISVYDKNTNYKVYCESCYNKEIYG